MTLGPYMDIDFGAVCNACGATYGEHVGLECWRDGKNLLTTFEPDHTGFNIGTVDHLFQRTYTTWAPVNHHALDGDGEPMGPEALTSFLKKQAEEIAGVYKPPNLPGYNDDRYGEMMERHHRQAVERELRNELEHHKMIAQEREILKAEIQKILKEAAEREQQYLEIKQHIELNPPTCRECGIPVQYETRPGLIYRHCKPCSLKVAIQVLDAQYPEVIQDATEAQETDASQGASDQSPQGGSPRQQTRKNPQEARQV